MTDAGIAAPARKQLGAADSKTRLALLQAAKELMREEGYAAVTSRRIAQRAGQKHQVIFYYFETLDDLLLEMFRRNAEEGLAHLAEAANAPSPLRTLWTMMHDPRGGRFLHEFAALGDRNPKIKAEIAAFAVRSRTLQTEILLAHLKQRGIEPRIPPVLAAMLMAAVAQMMAEEARLGMLLGHEEAETLVEACLAEFERTGGGTIFGAAFPTPA